MPPVPVMMVPVVLVLPLLLMVMAVVMRLPILLHVFRKGPLPHSTAIIATARRRARARLETLAHDHVAG